MLPWAPYEPAARAAKTNWRKSTKVYDGFGTQNAYQDDGGCEDRPFAREAIRSVAKNDDAYDFTDEYERSDVALGIAMRVLWLVELLKNCVHRSDDLDYMSERLRSAGLNISYSIEVAIGEEPGTTSNDRSASLPPRLCGHLDRRLVNALSGIRLFDGRLQSTWTEHVFDRHLCN